MKKTTIDSKIVSIYFIYGVFFWACQYAFSPYISLYLDELGASVAFSGFVIGSYGIFQMLLRVPIGLLSDRINRQRIFIIIGDVLLVLSFVILYFVQLPVAVLISRIFNGFSASIWICFIVVFQENYRKQGSVVASSKLFTVTSAGRLAGMLVATIVMYLADIKVNIIACLMISVVALILSFSIKDVKSDVVLPVKKSLKEALTNRKLMIGSFVVIFSQMVLFATVFGYSGKMIAINISKDAVGIINATAVIGMIIGALVVVKPVTNKLGTKKSLYLYFALFLVYTVTMPYAKSIGVMLIVGIVGGIGSGAAFSALMAFSISNVRQEIKTLAMGIFQTAVGIGVFIGPMLFAIVLDCSTLVRAYGAMSILILISVIFSLVLIKE